MVDVRDVCQGFLVDIGLLPCSLSNVPAARLRRARHAAAEESGDRDCILRNSDSDDNCRGELNGENADDQGPSVLDGHESYHADGHGGMDLDLLSEAFSDGALNNYVRQSMSNDKTKTRILCVRDEPDGFGLRNRVYSMPAYNRGGEPTDGPPVLVRNLGMHGAFCRCAAALEVLPPVTRDCCEPPPACLHEELLARKVSAHFLKALPCQPSHALQSDGGYVINVTPENLCENHMHVCVFANGALGLCRDQLSVVTLTPGKMTCSICHDQRKFEVRSKAACPHMKCCIDIIDANSEVEPVDADVALMNGVLNRTSSPNTDSTTFRPEEGIYHFPSLSDTNEKDNEIRTGVKCENVEISLKQIKPEGCQLGGPAHIPREETEINEPMDFFEPIPSVQSPLHAQTGCVYCNECNPNGWLEEEKSQWSDRAIAVLLTHSVRARNHTRHCSLFHLQCRLLSTGRAAGFHRQSHATMVRHEVMLLYWHVTKTMRGPGAESYGKMIEELHRLGGGTFSEEEAEQRIFMQADLLRKCIYGYLSRQRRPRRGCPYCPNGLCRRLTVDAKKLRNPVHLNSNGISPEQPTPGAEDINCFSRRIADRYFWPGDQMREARAAASALSASILHHRLRKGDVPFTADRQVAFASVPPAYIEALDAMLSLWKDENFEESLEDDGEVDEDACEEQHGGLGDTEEVQDYEASSNNIASTGTGSASSNDGGSGGSRRSSSSSRSNSSSSTTASSSSSISSSSISSNSSSSSSNARMSTRNGNGISTPAPFGVSIRTAPSLALVQAIAIQFRGMTNKQCEATQWLQKKDCQVLTDFFANYDADRHFKSGVSYVLRRRELRTSVANLIEAAGVEVTGKPGCFTLHPIAESLLREMLRRANEVRADLMKIPRRKRIPEHEQPPYDPSTGVAYNFTKHGKRLYWWPKFKTQSDRTCDCRKPDWMSVAPQGLSEGILTFLCLDIGVVVGNHMLTTHEGCKDAGAALYSFHPAIDELECVVCDTPCMHATYMNTRCGADFGDLQWAGDRFHIKPHTCRAVYDPNEYAKFDGMNTSLVEQWHSVMDCLTHTVKGSSLCNAMFLLQTLQDDHYLDVCAKKGLSPRNWN